MLTLNSFGFRVIRNKKNTYCLEINNILAMNLNYTK